MGGERMYQYSRTIAFGQCQLLLMKPQLPITKGFSMLEALAAMMVLSLLCLSLMSFQLQSMQAQRDALSMQQAVAMAQDLSQRMQVHPGAWSWYQLNLDGVPASWDCQQKSCTAQQWAQSDLADWWTELQQRLPMAKARMKTISNGTPKVELLLAWPSATLSDHSDQPPDCPASFRCWSASWRP